MASVDGDAGVLTCADDGRGDGVNVVLSVVDCGNSVDVGGGVVVAVVGGIVVVVGGGVVFVVVVVVAVVVVAVVVVVVVGYASVKGTSVLNFEPAQPTFSAFDMTLNLKTRNEN